MSEQKPNAELAYRALDLAYEKRALEMEDWVDGPADIVGLKELTGSCGTTACLAGWVAALAGYRIDREGNTFAKGGVLVGHVQRVAAELLAIQPEESEVLFFVENEELDEAVAQIVGPRPTPRCVASTHIPWPGASCNVCGAPDVREAP